MAALRARLTYANVVATIALFLTLGGGVAVAAATIGSGQVINDSLRSVDLKDAEGVRGRDVANDTLTGNDIDEGSLNNVLSAGVRADGTLERSTQAGTESAKAFSGKDPLTGQYVVTFPRDVRGCTATATIGIVNDSAALPPAGQIGTLVPAGTPSPDPRSKNPFVKVTTRPPGGAGVADKPFNLTVVC